MRREYPDGVGEASKQLRQSLTIAENKLWQQLRNRKVLGFKFRRQVAFCNFILDFLCSEKMLIIELDGPIHQFQKKEDHNRDSIFMDKGYTVLRFTNEQVLHDIDSVLNKIRDSLA